MLGEPLLNSYSDLVAPPMPPLKPLLVKIATARRLVEVSNLQWAKLLRDRKVRMVDTGYGRLIDYATLEALRDNPND